MLTQKATRATIKLGGIELDCHQMPDGCYKMSVKDIAKACNLDPKRLPEILEKKDVKALLGEALNAPELFLNAKVETTDGIRQAKLMDLKYVPLIWSESGTETGRLLVAACVIEALERRADAAFGVKRTEEERNDRLEARIDHADGWRKNFTDWQKLDGCESGLDYALRVKQLKAFGGLPVDIGIKDYDSKQVKKMTNCEVIYDAMRRKGLTHEDALRSL